MTLKLDVMKLISRQIDEMFGEYFEGQTILVTFSGKIISIHKHSIDALKWAESIKNIEFFVHCVGDSS